jgi:hypothetical protein
MCKESSMSKEQLIKELLTLTPRTRMVVLNLAKEKRHQGKMKFLLICQPNQYRVVRARPKDDLQEGDDDSPPNTAVP